MFIEPAPSAVFAELILYTIIIPITSRVVTRYIMTFAGSKLRIAVWLRPLAEAGCISFP